MDFPPLFSYNPAIMTYRETLSQIFSLARFGIKPGLERITALLENLGNPHDNLRVVAIAGTNGKGSTAAFLSSILDAAGYRVGLFTSPHLISFTERIRINGREISEDEVVALAEEVRAAAPAGTTFFEIVTAMAFLQFARHRVDFAIMEAGMGGRYDATNVADPLLSIITPISLDHCEYLGDNVEAIAVEKGGVIRSGRPVVSARQPDSALSALERVASAGSSRLLLAGRDFSAYRHGDTVSYHGMRLELSGLSLGLIGRHQAGNAAVSLAAAEQLELLGFSIPPDSCRAGVEQATWPGRMELFPGKPRILLDGAHNPAGGLVLAESLGDISRERLILVAGVMGDKDAESILAPLISLAHQVFTVAPAVERAMSPERLADLVRRSGVVCTPAGTVAEGMASALAAAGAGDLVLVAGSLFTVGEARGWILDRKCEQVRG